MLFAGKPTFVTFIFINNMLLLVLLLFSISHQATLETCTQSESLNISLEGSISAYYIKYRKIPILSPGLIFTHAQ